MESTKKGADRQKMHEVLRDISMKAWEKVQQGLENPIKDMLISNVEIKQYLNHLEIEKLMDAKGHTGLAKDRALKMAKQIKKIL